MKKLLYPYVIVLVVSFAFPTIGQISTAHGNREPNTDENQKGQQEINFPHTGPLTNGGSHSGTVQIGGTDTWTLPAVAVNDHLTVRIGEVTGAGPDPIFSPRLRVIRPDGESLGDDLASSDAAEVSARAPVAGTYTVLVSQDPGLGQAGPGSYRLTAVKSPGPYTISSGDEGGPMINEEAHSGSMPVGDIDIYIFHASANDSISMDVGESVSGGPDPGFFPRLRLIGPNGNTLDDVNGTNAAQIARLVPETGVYTVLISQDANLDQSAMGSYTLTMTGPPQPTLSINNVAQSEGDSGPSAFTFTVTLSGPVTQSVNVNYATEDESATAPDDYVAVGATQLTFNPGELTKAVTITVNGDLTIELYERFFVNLTGSSVVNISRPQGNGTINNDDSPGVIDFASGFFAHSENNGVTGVISARRMAGRSGAVSVQYATAGGGTATAGQDFTPTSGELHWADGETGEKSFSVAVVDDGVAEDDETVNLAITNPTGGARLGARNTAVLIIFNPVTVFANVSGRVTTPAGLDLRNAIVTLTDSEGSKRTATTSSFGTYSFDNVQVGSTYTISVSSKRYRFVPKHLQVAGNLVNLDFVGME